MIQIYSPGNRDFDENGDMVLFPSSFMSNDIELGKCWSETLSHPIDQDGRWKYIVNGAVVKAPFYPENGPLEHEQLYRIIRTEKGMNGITAELEPVIMQAREDCFLADVRPTGKTGQQALDIMTAGSIYSGKSDITAISTAYYEKKNLIEALNGDDENSFINRWGGEFLPNNFQAVINQRAGSDHGVSVLYGKNIKRNGIREDVDMSEVITRIYPQAYNGRGMSGSGYVDSPLIESYPNVKISVMKFENVKLAEDAGSTSESENTVICSTQAELDQKLQELCEAQYEAGIDKPKVTITVDMILLQNTQEYKNYKVLETVGMGDTVHCEHAALGIVTDARVIKMTYNHLTEKVESVTLGDYEYNYFDDVSSTVNRIDSVIRPDGTVIADKVQGFLNGVYTQLRLQSTAAQKQDVRAILFEDLDPNSSLYGAMALGTQGLQISRQRTADGKDWVWTTAMTAEGLIANIIVAGLLTDKTGRNFWNLDTGQMQLSGDFRTTAPNGYTSLQVNENILTMYNYLAQSTSPENAVFRIVSALDGQASGFGTMLSYQQDYGMSICRHQGDFGIITQSVMEFDINGAGSGIGVFEDINMNHCNITNQSDERLKENIQLTGSGDLEKLMRIPVVSFDWLETGERVDAGVIAQDIETLYPDCVNEDTNGVKQVIPAKLLYHLMRAVQELNDKVDDTQTIQGRVDKYSREEKLDFIRSLEKKKKERSERREQGGE